MSHHVIFLGAPGSGKGTQSAKVCSELGYRHVSTGDLLRKEIESQSKIGKLVDQIVQSGKLVDDKIVIDLLKTTLDLDTQSYIFDGFPRNIVQGNLLEHEILKSHPYTVFYFDVDIQTLVQRITGRSICPKCGTVYGLKISKPFRAGICNNCLDQKLEQRKDDTEEVFKRRFEIFEAVTMDLIKYYEDKNKLIRIDANLESEDIFNILKNYIQKF
jgi:adenylate kinase